MAIQNAEMKVEMLRSYLRGIIGESQMAIAKYAEGDTTYLVEWNGAALANTTLAKRFLIVLDRAERNQTAPEVLIKHIIRDCLNYLLFPTVMNSTNVFANAASIAQLGFYSNVLSSVGITTDGLLEAYTAE